MMTALLEGFEDEIAEGMMTIKSRMNDLLTDEKVKSVRNVLGIHFFGLKDFFETEFFHFDRDRYTVMVTRRSLLLAKWFLEFLLQKKSKQSLSQDYVFKINDNGFPYIEKSNDGKTCKNYILTDKADFSLLDENIREVHILDDISIHGKTLKDIKEKFLTQKGSLNVSTHAYMVSKESMTHVPDEYREIALRAEWCDLSRRIVDFINYLNLPYVSYINSFIKFKVEREYIEDIMQRIMSKVICEAFGDDNRNTLKKHSYFIIENNVKLLPGELLKCVRMYYSEITRSISIIPYVIMKPIESISQTEINNVLTRYISSAAASACWNAIEAVSIEYRSCFVYNLISCVASQAYGKYFSEKIMQENIFTNDWTQDTIGCLETSFGEQIAKLIKCNNNFDVDYVSDDSEEINASTLNKCKTSAEKFIRDICLKSWLEFENASVARTANSQTGYFTLQQLIDQMDGIASENKQSFIYASLLNLVKYCDSGKMNITCHKGFSESLVKAGELGCLIASEYLKSGNGDRELMNAVRSLLDNKYYRCLLI